jgi:uncharacterized protein (DUF1800 family)
MSPISSSGMKPLNPAEAWLPWQPTAAQPFDLKWAGHLYRRAAFGASLTELRAAVQRGLPATLDLLFHGQPGKEEREQFLESLGERMIHEDQGSTLRSWWIYVFLHTTHPLREKLTLFWHNHFATSLAKVQREDLMYGQNKLLRKHALGSFRALLLAMSADPAMLIWLDSNSNVKEKPNENFARELMELFSLGVGNYTERDIREAARAFTGWATNGPEFTFDADLHDGGVKTVLGQAGNWNGTDIVRICLEQPAAARFLVRKLYRFFVSEATAPSDALLEPLVQAYRKSDYHTGQLVQTILSSRHFFSDHAFRQRIKSPVELVLGAVREAATGTIAPPKLDSWLIQMGQQLFAPPNVKGWVGGKSWLNSATLLARDNFAYELTSGSLRETSSVNRILEAEKSKGAEDMVRVLGEAFFQTKLRPEAMARALTFAKEGPQTSNELGVRARWVAHALLSMPEYQLA